MDRLERRGRRHEDDFKHRAGVLQVDGGTPHHFFFQAVMAHVEKTKLRIQRRMVKAYPNLQVEKLLEEGFACVGMSRQLVADPYWPLKVSEGRENEILYCTYCNAKCVASIMTGQPVSCVQWGRAPKESSKEEK